MSKTPESRDVPSSISRSFEPGSADAAVPKRSRIVPLSDRGIAPRPRVRSLPPEVTAARTYFQGLQRELKLDTSDDPQERAENRELRQEVLKDVREQDQDFHSAQGIVVAEAQKHHDERVEEQGAEAHEYFATYAAMLRSEPDVEVRRAFADEEKESEEFQHARNALRREPTPETVDSEVDHEEVSTTTKEIVVVETGRLPEIVVATEVVEIDPNIKIREDITWANEVLESSSNLPMSEEDAGSGLTKMEYIEGKVTGMWQDPQRTEAALRIWKAHSGSADLYDRAKEIVGNDVQARWQDVTPSQLAAFTTINARGGYVAEDFGDILKQYFTGPSDMKQRVDAYYKFADAAIDIVDDAEASRKAAQIGVFETDIIPRDSEFLTDIHLASLMGFYDEEMRVKASIASQVVMAGIARSSGIDYVSIKETNDQALLAKLQGARLNRVFIAMRDRSIRENFAGYSKVKNVLVPKLEAMFGPSGSGTTQSVHAKIYENPEMIEKDQFLETIGGITENYGSDPMYAKFMDKLQLRATGGVVRVQNAEQIRQTGETPMFISFKIPGTECVLDVCMPASLSADRGKLIEQFIADTRPIESVAADDIGMYTSSLKVNGKDVYAIYRSPDKPEAERHDIDMLNAIGFPEVSAENIQVDNAELARKIDTEQIRFTNTRGFRVPLQHPALTALGYEYVDFRKDPNLLRTMNATIHVDGVDVTVKLDQDFRIDLEGKHADISTIGPSVQNVFLSILYPALCAVHAKDESGEAVEINKIVASRVGYIGFVREGYNFSADQAGYLLRDEGKDLATISEQRKVNGETRNSTYTRPKESDDPSLPPVKIFIPLPDATFPMPEVSTSSLTIIAPQPEQRPVKQGHPLGLTDLEEYELQTNPYRGFQGALHEIDMELSYISKDRARLLREREIAQREGRSDAGVTKKLQELFDDEKSLRGSVTSFEKALREEFDTTPQARTMKFRDRQRLSVHELLDLLAAQHDEEQA